MNLENFRQPEDIFRGTDFWMLNDRMTEEGIVHQIREMKKQGIYSFIARTYIGLKSDYPGKDFKSKMRIIIDTAKQYGMKVFLQAGYMPEAVVGLPADCALRYIVPVKQDEIQNRRVFCQHGDLCFVEHNSGTFLDMFDPEAMDYYLKKSYEEMWEEFSDEYGKTVLSVWVDEPSYNGNYIPFTRKIEKKFLERWGYSLTENIWKLYYDEDDYASVRYHYRVLLRDLLEENYFRKVRQWCNDHHLWFSGHLMMEETMTSQISRAGACMPYYKYFDIPGIDVLCGAMNWVDDPLKPSDETKLPFLMYTTPMQCVSAARQNGQEHILAEMYGVSTENMGFRGMMNMFDSYAAMGISHRSVHGMFYSLRGRGKRAYPPHVHYYQPYWEKYHDITDYCARVSEFISEGRTEGDIAIVHPLETGYTLYRGSIGSWRESPLNEYDNSFLYLVRMLKTIHRDPELCDLATLRDMGKAENGRLTVGKMSYGTLILPALKVITNDLRKLLEEFTEQGGRLILLGEKPYLLDGYRSETLADTLTAMKGVISVPDLTALEKVLADDSVPYRLTGSGSRNILVNRRVCGENEENTNFFLYNDDCAHAAKVTLTVDGCHAVYACSAMNGTKSPCPAFFNGRETVIPLTVDNGGSMLLSVENGVPTMLCHELQTVMPIDGVWTIHPQTQNSYYMEYCRYSTDGENFSDLLPIAAIQRLLTERDYHGTLTLRYPLSVKADLQNVSLALESPEKQTVKLDGNVIASAVTGYFRDKAFETILVGDIAAGEHCLTVEREFCPLSKATSSITSLFETQLGVELEPMYLLGSFTVYGTPEISRNGCMVYERDFVLDSGSDCRILTTDGELTENGYPFFAGDMRLSQTFSLDCLKQSMKMRIGVMNAAVGEVYLNGSYVGDLYRAPAVIDITSTAVVGENTLEIRLLPTLRNIVGPFHRPRGDVGNHFGGGYTNPDAAWLSVDTNQPGWEKKMRAAYPRWTDSYNLTPFGIDGIEIIMK